ncbi:unnamed protein product [Rotaria socialis]
MSSSRSHYYTQLSARQQRDEYTRQIGKQLDPSNEFKVSDGWLDGFRTRYNTNFRVISGESRAVNQDIITDWKTRLHNTIEHYDPVEIFNCDETGLFYKLMPDRSLTVDKNDCKGGKKSKKRNTVMLGTNWAGNEKLKPVVFAMRMLSVIDGIDALQQISIIDETIFTDDRLIEELDGVLRHLTIGGKPMSGYDYVSIDDNAPSFNEWDDSNDKLLVINGTINDDANSNEDQLNDDVPSENPPSLSECLDLVRRLRLFSTMQQPEFHLFIIELQSKLTDALLDSNLSKQRSVLDYFKHVLV